MAETKTYQLWSHWKQGDDLRQFLTRNADKPAIAMRSWSDYLVAVADNIRTIAHALETSGKPFEVKADAHYIGITGDEAVLAELAAKDLLYLDEGESEATPKGKGKGKGKETTPAEAAAETLHEKTVAEEKAEKEAEKAAEKEAAKVEKAEKAAEKEAEKAEKAAEKEAGKEAGKAEKAADEVAAEKADEEGEEKEGHPTHHSHKKKKHY